jgi:Ca2+-binding EF-hand superfamily protein
MRANLSTCATAVLAAAALLACVGAASAQDAPDGAKPPAVPGSGRFFDTHDANLDGKVTKEEFTGEADTFALLDQDGNGTIEPTELGLPADYKPRPLPKPSAEPPPRGGRGGNVAERVEKFRKMLTEWDGDKDGKVTKEEYKGKLPFETLDRNKDGVLSPEDLRGGAGKPGGGNDRPDMKTLDKNADGKITQEEFPGPVERFQAIDANKDGALSAEEMEAAGRAGPPGVPGPRMFQRFDKNGDGKVARDEFPGNDENFRGMDKNGDGFVTEDEIDALRGRAGAKGSPPPPPGTPGPMTEPPMEGGDAPPMTGGAAPSGGPAPAPAPGGIGGGLFAALDRDGDRKLSRAEFPGSDEEWRRLDRDGNGWITPDEAK